VEHTWHLHHLPKLEASNLESGDVAVCGSFAKPAQILGHLDGDRVAFAAPLSSRSDLEWLLRGLHLHPNVRHLVICGDDRRTTGQALLALWREGLDEQGLLPGSRGSLSADLDAASVDTLRSYVAVRDHRGEPLADVAARILELPVQPPEREPRSLPNPVIPERKVFLSRKTTFPIFSSDAGDAWLQLLNLALRIGTEKEAAGTERHAEALNAIVTIEAASAEQEFPACFDFNRDDFDRYYSLEAECDRLKNSLDTQSGTVVFLQPEDLAGPEAPNLISATLNAVDEKLFGSFVLRSADVYTDWPLEAMALLRLQRDVAERVGLEPGPATFVIHSACLHERDWDRAQRALAAHFKRPLPLQVDPSGIFLFGNDGGQARGMLLDHDANTILWEEAFSDPEDLSWYIVDVMPWLLPQHIRYVGQECASLMRAIREGECYEQG
jgi:hypothetical protein